MVRGRGCNESFRAAIDKSYDGPEEVEADGLSDKSSHSGHGALNCESAPQGNSELGDVENKARKVKKPKEKEKKKGKGKLKVKEKKQKEESEDPERKMKRKGFGAMLSHQVLSFGFKIKLFLSAFCLLPVVLHPGPLTGLIFFLDCSLSPGKVNFYEERKEEKNKPYIIRRFAELNDTVYTCRTLTDIGRVVCSFSSPIHFACD
ncbi:hypothetical protein STEG23_032126 [Scotinomys teguina]